MGALPVVLDDLGLNPNDIGKATEPTIIEDDNYLSDHSTGPTTPEPQQQQSTWILEK
jgi:hypothetical protein